MTPTDTETSDEEFLSAIEYRKASPTDISRCVEMVKQEPVPNGLMFVSKNELEYRQHQAAPYFRCAVVEDEENENGEEIIGFITGIRVGGIDDDKSKLVRALKKTCPHDPDGRILLIRSVVVAQNYRKKGVGKAMIRDYIETMRQLPKQTSAKFKRKPIGKVIGLCAGNLGFYMDCGFSVQRVENLMGHCAESQKDRQRCYFELSLALPFHCELFGGSNDDDEYRCYIVDSFASKPGTGNPAAVVLLREDFNLKAKHKWMQKVAAEFNLAETAFCWPRGSENGKEDADAIAFFKNESHWNIRYFTPTIEMGLCGHATLASAAVLYQTLPLDVLPSGTAVVFHASEDILTMNLASGEDQKKSKRVSKVSMDFPPKPTTEISTREEKATVRNMLRSAFSAELEPLYVGLSDIGDLLVEVKPEAFAEIGYDSLNFKALCEWDGYYRGIVICCVSPQSECDDNRKSIDFLSRFFAPKAGINEDPVTGSAHCSLGPYFAEKLKKEKVVGRQMSVRSGIVECQVTPDKVTLTGTAITTMNGKLFM